MAGIEFIRRTTPLNPLSWAFAISLGSLIASASVHAPTWLTVVLAIITALITAAFLIAYFYLMLHDRDALRAVAYLRPAAKSHSSP